MIDLTDPKTDIRAILKTYLSFHCGVVAKVGGDNRIFNLQQLTNWVYDYFDERPLRQSEIGKAWIEAEETAKHLVAAWKMAKLIRKDSGYCYFRIMGKI